MCGREKRPSISLSDAKNYDDLLDMLFKLLETMRSTVSCVEELEIEIEHLMAMLRVFHRQFY